jgi:hypothetical protein
VSPKFLGWAKELMSNIRSSITKDLIHSLVGDTQRQAYKHVENNNNSIWQTMFYQEVKELRGKYDDKVT